MDKRQGRRKLFGSDPVLNIGFGNSVPASRVVAIVSPNSAPIKRLKDEARAEHRLVDATCGRKTRSIIVTDSNHVILSAIQAETVAQRFGALRDKREDAPAEEA
ncbi:MAG: DUF370 domain-containing protein [Deltaproteobacteria bacterium]|nr:DUF370 domain-containing protein [Deltaproteobacteria bacterium]